MTTFRPPLREDLAGAEPYGAPQLDVAVQINVNENPYGPGPQVVAQIAQQVAEAARDLNRYPDREFVTLRSALAGYLDGDAERFSRPATTPLDPAQIWAANGSNEVMLHLLQAFGGPGRTAVSFAPTYSMYPEYARNTHTRWVTGQRDADFTVDVGSARQLIASEKPSVTLLPSPNNPTGTALPTHVVASLASACAEVGGVLVIDEAYAEFRRTGTPSALELVPGNPNLVVTRTMSKAFGLAGARVGYLAASVQICDALRIVRLPYHLSSVTQATAEAALAHTDTLLAAVDALRSERDDLVSWLRGQGLRVADSDANFVFFGEFEDRHALWEALVAHGVLIRETGPQGWLRASVGSPSETAAFKAALTTCLPDHPPLSETR